MEQGFERATGARLAQVQQWEGDVIIQVEVKVDVDVELEDENTSKILAASELSRERKQLTRIIVVL